MVPIEDDVISRAAEHYYHSTVAPISNNELPFIRNSLLEWYRASRRMLPWRGDDTGIPRSAYGTWISEVMLQQTRVETVIAYWNRWMQAYPDVSTLAKATPDEVNVLWAGLGYYRRAQMLLKGAQMVEKDFGGVLPQKVSELLTIPVIGPYTAGAIASIAYDQPEPLVDGNVIRVFSRLRALKLEVGGGAMEKACWQIAASLVPQEHPGDFNQALMELGATVCKPTSPSCEVCPLRSVCHARLLVDCAKSIHDSRPTADNDKAVGNKRSILDILVKPATQTSTIVADIEDTASISMPVSSLLSSRYDVSLFPKDVTEFPRKIAKKKAKELSFSVCVLRTASISSEEKVKAEGPVKKGATFKYLFVRRPATGLLANQWEFPSILLEDEVPVEGGEEETEDAPAAPAPVVQSAPRPEAALWSPFPPYFAQQLNMVWPSVSINEEESCGVKEEKPGNGGNGKISIVEMATESGFDPIIHVFSHQRHTMHILLKDVEIMQAVPSGASGENTPAAVESRWMSAEEIVAAGITTGCKKVLTEVSKARDGSNRTSSAAKKAVTKRAPKAQVKVEAGGKVKKTAAKTVKSTDDPVIAVDLTVDEDIVSDDDKCDAPVATPKNAFELMKFSANAAAPAKKKSKKA